MKSYFKLASSSSLLNKCEGKVDVQPGKWKILIAHCNEVGMIKEQI